MDHLDEQILRLLSDDARMTVKEIAARVSLTSPAVSERIRRLEKKGVIAGYTVVFGEEKNKTRIDALISISVPTTDRQVFLTLIESLSNVRQCFHVTGSYSYIVKVSCVDMNELEHLINRFQKLGQTSTQIILSMPVEHHNMIS
ncbi:MAG: Lrp/AsnC family transcriptional regulator [Ruthenibacterium sp.]